MSLRVVATALLALATAAPAADAPRMPAGLPRARVTRVIDGDTVDVVVTVGRTRVRLIGVDTPELHGGRKLDRDAARSRRSKAAIQALGREAAAYTRRRLLGRTIALEYDVQRHDRYGRTLAYVWLADGTLFNLELLRVGQARLMTVPPNVRHVDALRNAAREARAAGRGGRL
jgi:micrococcal nuclease